MSSYPSFEQAEGSVRQPRSGILVRTATNGQSRGRALTSATREDPVLVHTNLTQAELDQLRTFHENNRGAEFDVFFVAEGVTINALFKDPPWQSTPYLVAGGAKRFKVQVNLVQAD